MTAPAGLASALTAALADPATSPARARQLRWIAGELTAAADLPQLTGKVLTDPRLHAGYLAAADAGTLRRRASAQAASPDATRRVRRDCLTILLTAAGAPAPPRDPIPSPTPRDGVPTPALHALRAALTVAAARPGARDALVRAAALVALVTDTAARPAALAALTVPDLDLATGTVLLTEIPPGAARARRRLADLSGASVPVLAAWLDRRGRLIAGKTGIEAVFVSVAGNHDGHGTTRRPAGLPLQPRGLARAYAAAVATTNLDLAGAAGFPLPRTLGPLRVTAAGLRPPGTRAGRPDVR